MFKERSAHFLCNLYSKKASLDTSLKEIGSMKKNEILKALWEERERAVQISVMIILLYLLWDSENVQTVQ